MKLMKHITIALVLCAIPAMAFGQTSVTCDVCTHQASVFMGEGGLIATAAEGAEEVAYLASCDGVSRSGTLTPEGGMVNMLFQDKGIVCNADDGELEIGPIMDGGWFWITDADNSAVGNLIDQMVLDNEPTMITSAGDGVTMTMGMGAVYLKETASGRVGILPNILPEPPAAAAEVCGPRVTPNTNPAAYTSQKSSSCMLGDGGTKVRLQAPGQHGRTTTTTTVTRNIAGGVNVDVTADLWVNESGSYNTGDLTATPALANRGWAGKGTDNWLGNVGWSAHLHGATPGATLAGAGVEIADIGSNGQANITVQPSATYCPSSATATRTTAVVNIMAWTSGGTLPPALGGGTATSGTGADDTVFPALATQRALGGAYAVAQLTIMCPPSSSSANMGEELVPENPFPTDR